MKPSQRISKLQRDIEVQGMNGVETIKDPEDKISAVIKFLDEEWEKKQRCTRSLKPRMTPV